MSREILTRIRQLCGPDFIVGLAISDEPDHPVALTRAELAEIVGLHDEARLMDYVTCGTGSYVDFYKIMPPSCIRRSSAPISPPPSRASSGMRW
jgi:2,4-dienoyl-CoA reductase-like NADH-dependent reductase (Old Yellow Enzyme family)